MDITTLAAWGEFLGGIAVVVSLIYLAGQIRQNSRLVRASTATVTLEGINAPSMLMVQDPEVARIWFAGLADRSSLSELDLKRFDPLIAMQVSHWDQESAHCARRLGKVLYVVRGSRTLGPFLFERVLTPVRG